MRDGYGGKQRVSAKEVVIVGGYSDMDYGDWTRNKRNYLIG